MQIILAISDVSFGSRVQSYRHFPFLASKMSADAASVTAGLVWWGDGGLYTLRLETAPAPPRERPPMTADDKNGNEPKRSVAADTAAHLADRRRMVDEQIRRRDVVDERVLWAMEAVPRHLFVRPEDVDHAYADTPLPIGLGQTISQPYIVALMTELLALEPSHRVLEIGTGSGYQSAVLSLLCDEVFSVECVEPLGVEARERLEALGYDNVRVKITDGYSGWLEAAPFDAVIVTAAPESIPGALVDQLVDGGRMAIPVGAHFQELYRVVKHGRNTTEEKIANVRFVPMVEGPGS
jgi:protein-L-isoaspartate(D-aspartate) O-methyltransferase